MAEQRQFLDKLHLIQEQNRKVRKGCRHCGLTCYEALANDEDSILKYRQSFKDLPKDVADRDLLWIFGGAIDDHMVPTLEESPAIQAEHTSPTASSNAASDIEATSPSGSERGHGPQPQFDASSIVSEDESCDNLTPAEITSASESDPDVQQHPNHFAVSSDIAANHVRAAVQPREEVTSSSSEMLPLVSNDEDSASQRPCKKQRMYTCRRRTGASGATVPVQGILTSKSLLICRKAAEFLIGVGPARVQRVLEGRADGRKRGMNVRSVTSTPMSVCLRFLWRKYHFDAEGLPDKFSVQRHDSQSFTIGVQGAPNMTSLPAHSASSSQGLDKDEVLEEEERAIAGMALYIASAHEPTQMVGLGPGTHGGPARFIGVMKPIHLFLELEAWCAVQDIPKPSFQTLLRALDQCGCIRFRKTAGQHPNCDICMDFKRRLRAPQGPQQRAQVLEEYCKHILLQWFDRGVDSNSTELSRTCRRMLDMGALLSSMARQSSFWLLRADGVDQAKFRVPRCATKSHAFEKLIRPALHVQGAWCEGFGYHFAIADADMKKDTNNNIEVIARLMEDLYQKFGALPLAISLIQDNTSRECKNQKLLKFGVKLIALNCLESISFLYPEKGHTHGPLDGSFGQMCVKLSLEEFDDDLDVVDILDDFLQTSGLDAGTRQNAKAYKLDEAAEWVEWGEDIQVLMSALTGPDAPHYFRICRRKHVGTDSAHGNGAAEAAAYHRADHRGYQPNGNDVVMVVKERMASLEVSQIILMLPAADLGHIHGLPLQPYGVHLRRTASDTDRLKVCKAADAAFQAGAISQKACDYLTQWAKETRRRQPRPTYYHFLTHQVQCCSMPDMAASEPPAVLHEPRPVVVAAMGGNHNLPVVGELDDDAEPGALVIS